MMMHDDQLPQGTRDLCSTFQANEKVLLGGFYPQEEAWRHENKTSNHYNRIDEAAIDFANKKLKDNGNDEHSQKRGRPLVEYGQDKRWGQRP